MKIHRFSAANTQKAMKKIHEELGQEALIYSTRNFEGGVEVLAGLPHSSEDDKFEFDEIENEDTPKVLNKIVNEFPFKPSPTEINLIQQLNTQMQIMNEKVDKLSHRVPVNLNDQYGLSDDESIKSNVILYHLGKLGFRGKFCQDFLSDYVSSRKIFDILNETEIQKSLQSYIKAAEIEMIDQHNICALIGPTGIGKTTTIAKLAKRYIAKNGPAGLGLITTDYHDIASKNQLIYYSNLLNVDLEYANDEKELALALQAMQHKQLILIDTYGVSQRDETNVRALRDFLESQGSKISTYITLPCNVQEDILNDIAIQFKTSNLKGCILTKQDECGSIAQAVSVCMSHAMDIAYICNGQNIYRDIKAADANEIMQQIIMDANNRPRFADSRIVS